jgi:hypothetical protein
MTTAVVAPTAITPPPTQPVTATLSPTAALPTQTATVAPSATPSATPTIESTRAAVMTLGAIRLAVTASGVPEGSTEFVAQVDATRCAVIPPPTPTALAWAVEPNLPYLVSANCMGSDLPGQAAQVWQDGRWIETDTFAFADLTDLEIARTRYTEFLDLVSFQNGPPGADFSIKLATLMDSAGVLPSPQSCLADEIAGPVTALTERGHYVRLTFTQAVEWDDTYFLDLALGRIRLALPWSIGAVRQELVSIETGATVKQETLAGLAGTARLEYVATQGQWVIVDDASGYYCHVLPFFVN